MKNGIRAAIISAIVAAMNSASSGATIFVTSVADSGPGTLRAALAGATAGDTIDATGLSGTVVLTSGELLVTNSVNIRGPGPVVLSVSGNGASRVFHVTGSQTVAGIFSLAINNGFTTGPLLNYPTNSGAGILSDNATLTVSNCAFAGNSCNGGNTFGGGVGAYACLASVVGCSFISNSAGSFGGGVGGYISTVTVSNCIFRTNKASFSGGAVGGEEIDLEVDNCTIVSNYSSGFGGGIFHLGYGDSMGVTGCNISSNSAGIAGGICIESSYATFSNCIVSGNSATSCGGIWNRGGSIPSETTLLNCVVSSNWAPNFGGGIRNDGTAGYARLALVNCTLGGNSSTNGGAILNDGNVIQNPFGGMAELDMTNCTVSGNSATSGGGIFSQGNFFSGGGGGNASGTICNCTFSGNWATNGGAIYNSATSPGNQPGTAHSSFGILNSTFSGNSAAAGSCIYNVGFSENPGVSSTYVTFGSTILQSASGGNISNSTGGIFYTRGYNLCSDGGSGLLAAATDQLNTDAKLGPLQDNGGPVETCALRPGSPAIDQGNSLSGTATDERGQPRSYDNPGVPNAAGGDGADVGAFEFVPPALGMAPNYGNVILSWSTNFPGYNAESATVLGNSLAWTNVPGTALIIGGQYLIGDGPVTGSRFYRLRGP